MLRFAGRRGAVDRHGQRHRQGGSTAANAPAEPVASARNKVSRVIRPSAPTPSHSTAGTLRPGLPAFAGETSFGGNITSAEF